MFNDYPFLSKINNKKTEEEFICLIQTISKNYISFFSLNDIKSLDKIKFLSLCDKWWKNANDMPITLYYKTEFDEYNYCKHHMNNNDYEIIDGFIGINLKNLSEKRIKRKIIHIE